ncbi:uncharacterized [Tachysurus ichikawai]
MGETAQCNIETFEASTFGMRTVRLSDILITEREQERKEDGERESRSGVRVKKKSSRERELAQNYGRRLEGTQTHPREEVKRTGSTSSLSL